MSQPSDDTPTNPMWPAPGSQPVNRVFDPVCGMDVDSNAQGVERSERNGESYFFCSEDCRKQFEATPEEFAA